MSYIKFNKTQLVNLSYSLSKEYLRANQYGSYASSTIIGCNTRKYHGLLVTPQPQLDGELHVLLSSLDETIIHKEQHFHLAVHKYPGKYSPTGHKYIEDLQSEPIPRLTYRVGDAVLEKEIILISHEDRFVAKYTLVESSEPLVLRLQPFLAYRSRHALSKANFFINKKYEKTENGIVMCLYDGYLPLYMQTSCKSDWVSVPDWFYNMEYIEEKERGYEYLEDLFTPGYFEVTLKKGDTILFSAGTVAAEAGKLGGLFKNELKKRIPRTDFKHCLMNAARQFMVERGHKTELIAGFPWFERWGRDTFIALPGLSLAYKDLKIAEAVIDTLLAERAAGFFPNTGHQQHINYHSVDTDLWFVYCIQKLGGLHNKAKYFWKKYGSEVLAVIARYQKGSAMFQMHDNKLIWQGEKGKALTWMDAVIDGQPVNPRTGYVVEINALWYNALCFADEGLAAYSPKEYTSSYKELAQVVKESFVAVFTAPNRVYLADYVDGEHKDFSVRPNQIIAAALPYSPLAETLQHSITETVKSELLTPRGLRSLAPKNPIYEGIYEGNQASRDRAYHNGTVWVWLLSFYAEIYLKLHGRGGLRHIRDIYAGFEPTMYEHGITTISEIYDGNPPHYPKGAISQAWSVGAILLIEEMLEE